MRGGSAQVPPPLKSANTVTLQPRSGFGDKSPRGRRSGAVFRRVRVQRPDRAVAHRQPWLVDAV